MQKIVLLLTLSFAAIQQACPSDQKNSQSNEDITQQIDVSASQEPTTVVTGAMQLMEYVPLLTNKKVGLMVNQTSTIDTTHLVDTLLSIGVDIGTIFAPEHGFRGDHSAGAHVDNSKDPKTGLPITSLYGSKRKPTSEMLEGLDIVIFDIQDVGVRFYTYISSMHYLMEACAENDIQFIVLDRPNPNGHFVDGPVLEKQYSSFIGMHEVPLVHGMTVGEFAQMINGEKWLKGGLTVELKVIPCKYYDHNTLYQLPIRPSPNLPNMASVYLYPSLGLFEGTNVSVGRGTDKPFQILGRPGESDGDLSFTPRSIPRVSDHPKYKGKECRGVDLEQIALNEVKTSGKLHLKWLIAFYKSNPESSGDYFKGFFTKLAGNKAFQKQIESGMSEDEIRATWVEGCNTFREMRQGYLLYPDTDGPLKESE